MDRADLHYTREREDYFVRATVWVAGAEIPGIPCRVFLPERITQKPLLYFKPTREQYKKATAFYKGTFNARIPDHMQEAKVTLSAPTVYFSQMETLHWGPGVSESSFTGEPQHLRVVRCLTSDRAEERTLLTLWITPNPMLRPVLDVTTHYTGSIEANRIRQLSFSVCTDIVLTFDEHFRTVDSGGGETRRWSYLVGECEIDIPASDVDQTREKVLPKVDDILAIASLGSRTRTACTGWAAIDQRHFVEYYRGEYTFPSGESEPSLDQGLVRQRDFAEFLATCYANFLQVADKGCIRNAIVSVVPGKSRTLEGSFLNMFASLEALILAFRREFDMEYVIPDAGTWAKLRTTVKKSISAALKDVSTKKQRAMMYEKVDELNRVSLSRAFSAFCSHYNIDLSDLWPVFGSGGLIGLVDIRNRLIHGEVFLHSLFSALSIAHENLKLTVERGLVSVLGFPIERTEIDRAYLIQHATAVQEMQPERDRMSAELAT